MCSSDREHVKLSFISHRGMVHLPSMKKRRLMAALPALKVAEGQPLNVDE